MKTSSLLLLFFLFVSSPIFAQITITTADVQNMFAVGKAHTSVNIDDVSAVYMMNVGSPSPTQQSWTMLSGEYRDTLRLTNTLPSSTPYANKFPLATHAQSAALVINEGTGELELYVYVRIANDSLLSVGSVFRLKTSTSDTTIYDLHRQFTAKMPISVGSIMSSRDSSYNGPGDYEIKNTTETFDAFGAITLPVGIIQSLRSKKVEINEVHRPGQAVTTDTVIQINWMTKEGHSVSAEIKNNSQTSGNIQVNSVYYTWVAPTSVGVQRQQTGLPNAFMVEQNYPNPFNPTTVISYQLPADSKVSLRIYDMLGREIATLVNEQQSAGWKEVKWDASGVSSGMYIYRIGAGSFMGTKKMIVMR